jgi:dihydrofolate reductase
MDVRGLLTVWNARGGPFKDALNNTPKYVASTTLKDPLRWPNSTLLHCDVAEAVGALKARSDGVLGIMGSGELIGSLTAANLIDEYLLMIHPLVLGTGRRLFPEGAEVPLRLAEGVITSAGVVIATYEPARRYGAYARWSASSTTWPGTRASQAPSREIGASPPPETDRVYGSRSSPTSRSIRRPSCQVPPQPRSYCRMIPTGRNPTRS